MDYPIKGDRSGEKTTELGWCLGVNVLVFGAVEVGCPPPASSPITQPYVPLRRVVYGAMGGLPQASITGS
jgi:hypothetical protein